MAKNRYALISDSSDNEPLQLPPAMDPAQNPFLNQVADESIPWQEVKKRGAPAVQPMLAAKNKVLTIRDPAKAYSQKNVPDKQRNVSPFSTDNGDKVYDPHENWCGVCSQKFANKAALQNHIKQSPNHKHYCNLCKRVFKDRNGLKNHVDNSYGHDVFCNLCLSAFNDEWGLKNHFENNYAVGHEFVCLTCLLGFRSQTELGRHLHTAPKHTWCESCHRRFRNQDERDEHWQKTTKHKHCLEPGCDFDGPDQAVLDKHLQRDHFQCTGCQRILPSQTKLNQHLESCDFAMFCPQCHHACSGQAQLATHLQQCFYCKECDFLTNHEGNYQIHMTKHTCASIGCWGCDAPMRTFSSLINHLESGRCPNMPDPARLIQCLGRWWYSTLYMDISIHAMIRTGRADPEMLQEWIREGIVQPFTCRAEECSKSFGHLSSLVLHCESKACDWDIARLNMPGLEKEVKQTCIRRDSASA